MMFSWSRTPLCALTQVDDLFLRTNQYVVNATKTSYEEGLRITGQDMENHKKWQDELNANLPASSRVVIVCDHVSILPLTFPVASLASTFIFRLI